MVLQIDVKNIEILETFKLFFSIENTEKLLKITEDVHSEKHFLRVYSHQ